MKTLRQYTIRSLGFFIFFSALASPARGGEGDHSAGLLVGQTWSAGEIGKGIEGGSVAPGLIYEYAASEVFSVYAQAVRSEHGEGALRVFSTTAGIKAHLVYYDKLAPFVLVGAGLYFVRKNFTAPDESAKKTVFGFHLGLGADLDISERFFAGLQFDIHSLFAGTAIMPSTRRAEISGRMTGFFLRGGVRF